MPSIIAVMGGFFCVVGISTLKVFQSFLRLGQLLLLIGNVGGYVLGVNGNHGGGVGEWLKRKNFV